jgi:glycosyltransferase XagB
MRHKPALSAARSGPAWQSWPYLAIVALCAGSLIVDTRASVSLLAFLLTLPFLSNTAIRLFALLGQFSRQSARKVKTRPVADHDLPTYTIMVGLYQEAEITAELVAALSRIDYPAAKLEVLFVVEDEDTATKLAFLRTTLAPWMCVVLVPDGQPRTKPRALNYALRLARGDYVAVFDAEDRPEPDQLRRAVALFRANASKLACVQASLNVFNVHQNWLTRQFTVEYSALFDALLPALQRLGMPIPLGGTSNHFPREILTALNGWDPFNVTEDADLGIRLARLGYQVGVIPSTTWEEAPASLDPWFRQRTRWLKGWMQTYLVHTRHPIVLARELGFGRWLGFQLYFGGLILSALVHPLAYAVLIASWMLGPASTARVGLFDGAVQAIAIGNLVAGYATAILVGVVAARRRHKRLVRSALQMPLYWLLISLAAYRALFQLVTDPYKWEKTPHGFAEED